MFGSRMNQQVEDEMAKTRLAMAFSLSCFGLLYEPDELNSTIINIF